MPCCDAGMLVQLHMKGCIEMTECGIHILVLKERFARVYQTIAENGVSPTSWLGNTFPSLARLLIDAPSMLVLQVIPGCSRGLVSAH